MHGLSVGTNQNGRCSKVTELGGRWPLAEEIGMGLIISSYYLGLQGAVTSRSSSSFC